MKSNNLPKIAEGTKIYKVSDESRCPIFPRNEHPDTRSNKEFLAIIKGKVLEKQIKSSIWYPAKRGNRSKPVICLNNKKEYHNIQDASKELKVPMTRLWRHLNGFRLYDSVNGFKFRYL